MRSHTGGTIHRSWWQQRHIDIQHRAVRWAGLLTGVAATVVLLAFGAGQAAAESCAPPSYKVARAAFGCEYIRLLRVQRNGAVPDFSRCEQQVQRKISLATSRYDACPSTIELQGEIDQCVADARALIDPGTNHVCRMRYFSQARAFSRCRIGAILKSIRTGEAIDASLCSTRLGRVPDRTQARLDGCPVVANADFEASLLDCIDALATTVENAPTPTATATVTETSVPLDTATPTATPEATATTAPQATDTPAPEPTDTPEPEPTATLEPEPTDTPEPQPTDTPVPDPTDTPEPTATPEPELTDTPTEVPTDTPEPTATPTPEPTFTPTESPTEVPTVPTDFRRVFVTSTTTNGNFPNGVEGADAFCQERADTAGLPGRFVAWLSTGDSKTQARDRLENAPVPYFLVDGSKIADDFNDLVDGTLDAPINLDEYGTLRNVNEGVWTGSAADGTGVSGFNDNVRCRQWKSSAAGDGGRVGSSNLANSQWTNSSTNVPCDNQRRLYCFQSNHRTVFVTSTTHDGDLGGERGADAICQARADAAGVEGHYVAWLSTGDTETRARRRLENAPAPYRMVDGTKVADTWDDLVDGTLDNPLNLDETGAEQSAAGNVWTGTAADGTGVSGGETAVRCGQWTSNSSSDGGRVGSSDATNGQWTNSGNNIACDQPRRLYCVESQLKCGNGSKCVFRTKQSYFPNLGGLAGADAICQSAADSSANIAAGTYKAWLSTESESASSRLTHATVPYRLPNGDSIADDWADLTDGTLNRTFCDGDEFSMNSLQNPCIGVSGAATWTGTDVDGSFTGPGSCLGWTSNSAGDGSARRGDVFSTGSRWTSDVTNTCDSLAPGPVYCIQQ